MHIEDKVYGRYTITDPLIKELILSAPLQRLKDLHQAGASQFLFPERQNTRFEHSLGVWYLLQQKGASRREQVAGLLHDTPHTAFSHVIDFVFPNVQHNYHEQCFEKVLQPSEIPHILQRYGFTLDQVINHEGLTLLEKEIPDLCADRFDYAVRDACAVGVQRAHFQAYPRFITNHNGELMFTDAKVAREFASDFMDFDANRWGSAREAAIYRVLADAIKSAYDANQITEADLFGTDASLFAKLRSLTLNTVRERLALLTPFFQVVEDEHGPYVVKPKIRYVDPQIVDAKGNVTRVSEQFPEMQERMARHQTRIGNGYRVRVL